MNEKDFQAIKKIYAIKLQKIEKKLIQKKGALKEREQETQTCIQMLRDEKEAYQAIDNEMDTLMGKPARPIDIEILRSRQARKKHDISQADTQLREAQNKERRAREDVRKEAKNYQEQLLRRDNFQDAVWPILQEEKRKEEERREEQELAP